MWASATFVNITTAEDGRVGRAGSSRLGLVV
jgi:hypothetical protein